MRKLLCFVATFLLLSTAFAQKVEVSGKVVGENNQPLPGVSVQEKNTSNGTSTDASGSFRLSVSRNATLVFSSVGYDRKEAAVGADPRGVTISLTPASGAISEVVVTALGIRREKKALGYAVTTVDRKQLEQRPEADITRVLNGKTPGVDIGATSGISGSGTNIVIRGISSITGETTPLFIVDGVPFDASTNAQSDFRFGNQTSSRFLDLDPNNIESVSVLRGLSATVLYGEQGRNGVILITTKNGSNRRVGNKAEVTLTQSTFANKVASLPEWTNAYGGGTHLSTGFQFYSNWGAAFQNPPVTLLHPYSRSAYAAAFPELQGVQIPFEAHPNNINDFFRTGWINTTSINVAGSPGTNSNVSGNFTFYNDKGFIPGNDLRKYTGGLGGSTKLSNRFTISGVVNFANTDYQTPPNSASTGSGPQYANYPGIFADVMYTPRSIDLMGWPYENPLTGASVYYRPSNDIQNPRWTAKYVKFTENVQRVYGNLALRYDLLKNLNIMYRIGLDNYANFNTLQSPKGGVQVPLGVYRTTNIRNTILNHELLANYNTRLSTNWDFSLTAGSNLRRTSYRQDGMFSENQLVFNLFNHNNFINHTNKGEDGSNLDFKSEFESLGVFAEGNLGYKDFLYATVGGRNSWVSTLEKANRSLFYPSASLSFIPTAAVEGLRNNPTLNYVKLRVGYATSARFPDPYRTRQALSIGSNVFVTQNGTQVNSNSIPNRLPNPDLKPELLREVEAGLETRLFSNRINLDFTWYNRVSKDQIISQQLDPSTGYTEKEINVGGVRNRGIEVGLNIAPVKGRDFGWDFTVNFTRNRNEVTSLVEGVKQIPVAGFTDLGGFAMVGKPLGIMQGYYVQRDPKTGQRIVDNQGNYLSSTEIGIIGDPNPDFKTSLINNLTYKGLSFRMQWDYTQGGDIYSATIRSLLARGETKDTEFDRALPVILPGVKQDGTPNDIQVDAFIAYFNSLGFGASDVSVFDGTVIRLREASLSYNLPANLLSKTPFGGISLTFSGQNLWYKAPNTPKYMNFDPETSGLGASSYRGFEFITGPSSRRFGGSIRVTF
jgi:TonB-linked SusC/RagA family outer membrane protein